ncbi:RHS repeat domain-containing protein [Photobacterium nomapromontoriensis]|uniref:RHS repeat domain-containing protein n=1 Tax=Photobacterium nomapromontoriensis TaxID=2910237 RepID=UPI003D0A0509
MISLAEQGERFIKLRRDECGRVLEQRSSVAGTTHSNHFQYDKLGRLRHANNAQRKLSFHYHANGQQSEVWQDNWRLQHHHDNAGRRIRTQLPDNHQIQYHYNNQGLLVAIEWDQQSVCTREFDSNGRETQRQQGNGIICQQSFDVQGRLQQQLWSHPQQSEHQRHYRYSLADQLVGIEDSEQGASQYQFDVLDQLTSSQLPHQPEILFTFDSFGNPQRATADTLTSAADNGTDNCSDNSIDDTVCVSNDQLLQWHDTHYRYDRFGNQVKTHSPQGNEQRRFNGLNQLTSFRKTGKYTQYHYDALGRRSAKISESQRIDYLWDGDQLIGEHCNGEYRWYLYEPGSFSPVALIAQGEIYY